MVGILRNKAHATTTLLSLFKPNGLVMTMKVRVAAVGPRDLLVPVTSAAADLPGISLVSCGYADPAQTHELILSVRDGVHAYLFNGPVPARLASALIPHDYPSVTVRYDPSAVANTLFRIYRELPHAMEVGVSIDCLGQQETNELEAELGLAPGRLRRYDLRSSWEKSAIVDHHRQLLKQRQVAAAAVGLRAAYQQLKGEGLPVYNVRPTKLAIRSALAELIVRARHYPQRVEQMAVMIITLAGNPDVSTAAWRMVLEYMSSILDGKNLAVRHLEGRAMAVVGDAAEMKAMAGLETGADLSGRIQRATTIAPRIGYGVAETLPEARFRAELALRSRDQAGISIVNSYHDAKVADEYPQHLPAPPAPAARPSPATRPGGRRGLVPKRALLQAQEVRDRLGTYSVTADDVANALRLSVRSGRRLLLAWSDAGLADLVGSKINASSGRPRQVYELRL